MSTETGRTTMAPIVYPKLSPRELAQRWNTLRDGPGLPERCELDEYGDVIEVAPPKTAHQRIVSTVQRQIHQHLGGEPLPGVGVLTSIGVRVPDVVWQASWSGIDPVSPAPTICVEVQSEQNTRRELSEKVAAYVEAGAREVILVEMSGRIRFFGAEGERAASAMCLSLSLPPGTYPR